VKIAANTVELIGALVTAYGLLFAYGRARGLPNRIRAWWAKIRGERQRVVIAPAPFGAGAEMGIPDVHVGFHLDAELSTPEQLAQLESYVRELRTMFGPVNSDIARLDRAIDQTRDHADTAAAQALTDAKTEITRFGDRLDELQAVDLRIAALGVVISAVGILLGYWA
jgi:hypothetical protein